MASWAGRAPLYRCGKAPTQCRAAGRAGFDGSRTIRTLGKVDRTSAQYYLLRVCEPRVYNPSQIILEVGQ